MKKVKAFIKENKVLIIGVGVAVVGGIVVYKLTKSHIKLNKEAAIIVKALSQEPTFPTVTTLTEAVDIFKEYQETSNQIALFWEKDNYSILNLSDAMNV